MSDDCIFCKIISGKLPSFTLYEDGNCKAILDRFPSQLGHTIIIAREHAVNIFALEPETGAEIFKAAMCTAAALKASLDFDGINLLQNNGEAAGQTINHFHIHLIPRYKEDSVQFTWQHEDPTIEEFEKLAVVIREKF